MNKEILSTINSAVEQSTTTTNTDNNGGIEMNGIEIEHISVHPDEQGYMDAEALWNALIPVGLTDSDVYQREIVPRVDKVLELHPLATMSEIADTFIDDVLELVDDMNPVTVQILEVEDYCGTDRGYQDCSYILGYRIVNNCGAKI